MIAELAVQPKMDVQHAASRKVVGEMLTVSFDRLELLAAQHVGPVLGSDPAAS